MIKTFKLGNYRLALSVFASGFIGLGIRSNRTLGLSSWEICLPFVEISFGIWSRNAMEKAAIEIAQLAQIPDVEDLIDWSIYAPNERKN